MILTNATYLTPAYKFEKKDLYITNGQIYTEKPDKNEHEVMDCEDYIVIPGLVNAHFHSYSPLAKGLMKDMALEDWADTSVQGIVQQAFFAYVDEKMTENDLWILSQKSYIDMVRGGIAFVSESDPLASPVTQKKIIESIGIRGMVEAFKAEDVWKMATENGAKAYQLGNKIGQINDGYEADLALIKKDMALAMLLNQENSTYAHNLLMSCGPSSVHYGMGHERSEDGSCR